MSNRANSIIACLAAIALLGPFADASAQSAEQTPELRFKNIQLVEQASTSSSSRPGNTSSHAFAKYQLSKRSTFSLQRIAPLHRSGSPEHASKNNSSIMFPDAKKQQPGPAQPIPIPYPNTSSTKDNPNGSKKVKVKTEVMLKGTRH